MKAAIFGDVHYDHPKCYREEFLKAIEKIAPEMDIIILNGDFMDSYTNKARKLFEEFIERATIGNFFEKLFFVRSSSLHDGILDWYCDLLMDDYAILSMIIGQVIIIHGNKVGLYGETGKEELMAIRAKEQLINNPRNWLPIITQEHHVIFSHLHRRFYNERKRVYGTGCWIPTKDLRSEKVVMIIDDQEENDPIRNISFRKLMKS